jgi:hypothetical protein
MATDDPALRLELGHDGRLHVYCFWCWLTNEGGWRPLRQNPRLFFMGSAGSTRLVDGHSRPLKDAEGEFLSRFVCVPEDDPVRNT